MIVPKPHRRVADGFPSLELRDDNLDSAVSSLRLECLRSRSKRSRSTSRFLSSVPVDGAGFVSGASAIISATGNATQMSAAAPSSKRLHVPSALRFPSSPAMGISRVSDRKKLPPITLPDRKLDFKRRPWQIWLFLGRPQ